jgi:hypothetical protein
MLWNTHPPPPRKPRPAEPLWTLINHGGDRIDAQLRAHGEYGWEFQLLRRGDFYAGRWFDLRAHAIAWADEIRRDLEKDGWATGSVDVHGS